MSRRSAARAALVLSGVLGSLAPATAQSRDEIHFAPGNDHATVEGSITGHAYADHVLVARAGQTMSVSLQVKGTDGDGTIYFNILPPGSDGVAIFNGSTSEDGRGTSAFPRPAPTPSAYTSWETTRTPERPCAMRLPPPSGRGPGSAGGASVSPRHAGDAPLPVPGAALVEVTADGNVATILVPEGRR